MLWKEDIASRHSQQGAVFQTGDCVGLIDVLNKFLKNHIEIVQKIWIKQLEEFYFGTVKNWKANFHKFVTIHFKILLCMEG